MFSCLIISTDLLLQLIFYRAAGKKLCWLNSFGLSYLFCLWKNQKIIKLRNFSKICELKFWVHCPIFCTTFCHWLIYYQQWCVFWHPSKKKMEGGGGGRWKCKLTTAPLFILCTQVIQLTTTPSFILCTQVSQLTTAPLFILCTQVIQLTTTPSFILCTQVSQLTTAPLFILCTQVIRLTTAPSFILCTQVSQLTTAPLFILCTQVIQQQIHPHK